jgi:hypothetical protein
MLWYKGWLETRWRAIYPLGIVLFVLISGAWSGVNSSRDAARMLDAMSLLWAFAAVLLASCGVRTQVAFRATKGIDGSTHFTLSLPVSRFRLVAVRAGVGLAIVAGVATVACVVLWFAAPRLGIQTTLEGVLGYATVILTCGMTFHFLSVLFATFLDEMWQMWGSAIVILILRWLSSKPPVPQSLNIFRAMGSASPLMGHAMPWAGMALSVGLSASLFLMAFKIAQVREY